jgi:short subunit dehydrogenase-like uncharacterized protein
MTQCIQQGAHYLDLSHALRNFEAAHLQHQNAERSGSIVLPGVGLETVAGDCLAALLRARLPDATHLTLAFDLGAYQTRGTLYSHLERLRHGGMTRHNGRLVPVPLAHKTQNIAFPKGHQHCASFPTGDLYSAYISTEIQNITVFSALSAKRTRRIQTLNRLHPLLNTEWLQGVLKWYLRHRINPPTTEQRAASPAYVWGEASNARGMRCAAHLVLPNVYTVTAQSAVKIAQHLLTQVAEGGYYTPSLLLGAGYIRHLTDVQCVWET